MFLDGSWLKRSQRVAVQSTSSAAGDRGMSRASARCWAWPGGKEDKASAGIPSAAEHTGPQRRASLQHETILGLLEALGDSFTVSRWQRGAVHFYLNVMSVVPRGLLKEVARMVMAILAQESHQGAYRKIAAEVAEALEGMKLGKAELTVREGEARRSATTAIPASSGAACAPTT